VALLYDGDMPVSTTIALCIPHRPDIPERAENVKRILAALGEAALSGVTGCQVHVLTDLAPNRVWARRMWAWGLETGADVFLTLQDDVELAPRFLGILRAMLPAVPPSALLGLAGHHPGMKRAVGPWARSGGWVVGWAHAMRRGTLAELVARDASKVGAAENEDEFINHFVAATGREVWHPVPSPVDHRLDLASTYENDGRHPFRASHVRWDGEGVDAAPLTDPAHWRVTSTPPWLDDLGGAPALGGMGGPLTPPGAPTAAGFVQHVAPVNYDWQPTVIRKNGNW
jgi:hypothetical protein